MWHIDAAIAANSRYEVDTAVSSVDGSGRRKSKMATMAFLLGSVVAKNWQKTRTRRAASGDHEKASAFEETINRERKSRESDEGKSCAR